MNIEIESLTTNKTQEESILKAHKESLKKIEQDYLNNKDKAIEFLVKALLDVDLIVPDVVIGRFAHKLLINK